MGEHRGNGKNERCVRTITERLRANKRFVLQQDNTGLSNILFSFRTARGHNDQSPAEVQMNRNNIAGLLKRSSPSSTEGDAIVQLKLNEFPHESDSKILVRERALRSQLEPACRCQRGRILSESKHILSLLPAGKANPRLLSKHEVAHAQQQTDIQPPPRDWNTRRETTSRSEATVIDEQTSSVQEQIAALEPVGRKERACKGP